MVKKIKNSTFNLLKNVFREFSSGNSISAVMHFAGLKAVSESISLPLKYWNSNVLGTINLLKVMDEFNCRNLVFSSSATVYRAINNKLLNEDDICEPVNPYGRNKLTIENILKDIYHEVFGY